MDSIDLKDQEDWKDIYPRIKPLDLIFFASSDPVSGAIRLIQRFTLGQGSWSHVGVVVNKRILPCIQNAKSEDHLYIWESILSLSEDSIIPLINKDPQFLLNDVESGEGVFGVQLRDLHEMIQLFHKNEANKIGWGRLLDNPTVRKEDEDPLTFAQRQAFIRQQMTELHRSHANRSYELNPLHLVIAIFPCLGGFLRKLKCVGKGKAHVFCSEFVALVYKKLGLIGSDVNESHIVPMDLANAFLSDEFAAGKMEQLLASVIYIT